MMDLKIKVAKKANYPFFIISYNECKEIDQNIGSTILDGIIGQVFAKKEFRESLQTLIDYNRDCIEKMHSCDQHEFIQDLIFKAEKIAEIEWDQIAKLGSKLMYKAFETGVIKSYQIEYINDPKLPDGDPFLDQIVLEKRIEAMQKAGRVGCQITVLTPQKIVETVWLRNFEDKLINPAHRANNIADLLISKKAIGMI